MDYMNTPVKMFILKKVAHRTRISTITTKKLLCTKRTKIMLDA